MKRSQPLRRKTPLARSTKPRQRGLQRPHMDKDLRQMVIDRAQGRCDSCARRTPEDAFDAHHRKLRTRGGEDSMANLVAVCRDCHNWIHGNPLEATAIGFMVASWDEPERIAVKLHGSTWVTTGLRLWKPIRP